MTADDARRNTHYLKYLQAYVDCLAKAAPTRRENGREIRESREEALSAALAWRHATENKDPVSQSELVDMMDRLLD